MVGFKHINERFDAHRKCIEVAEAEKDDEAQLMELENAIKQRTIE